MTFKHNSPGCACCTPSNPTVVADCGGATFQCEDFGPPFDEDFCAPNPGPRSTEVQLEITGVGGRQCLRGKKCECVPQIPRYGEPGNPCTDTFTYCGYVFPDPSYDHVYDCFGAVLCECPDPDGTYILTLAGGAPNSFPPTPGACVYYYPFTGGEFDDDTCHNDVSYNYLNGDDEYQCLINGPCDGIPNPQRSVPLDNRCYGGGNIQGVAVVLQGADLNNSNCKAQLRVQWSGFAGSNTVPDWGFTEADAPVVDLDCATVGFDITLAGFESELSPFCVDPHPYDYFEGPFSQPRHIDDCRCDCQLLETSEARVILPPP